MAAVPMRPGYGPTLGQLLAPRWSRASRSLRWGAIGGGMALVALAAAVALTLLNSTYSHAGRVPFSFSYRGLYATRPDPGGYAKVQALYGDGEVKYSFAVDPLTIPRYAGEAFGELPLYASVYARALRNADTGFVFRGEGKTRVSTGVVGYQVLYTELLGGEEVYGRDVMLLKPGAGSREGVILRMLTAAHASPQVRSPLEVAGTGVLLRPLKTFAFG